MILSARPATTCRTPSRPPQTKRATSVSWWPERQLAAVWLEGQAHTKFHHSRRTQTKHTSSETGAVDQALRTDLTRLRSGVNAVDRAASAPRIHPGIHG